MEGTQELVPEERTPHETTSWMVFLGVIPILTPCRFRTGKSCLEEKSMTQMPSGHGIFVWLPLPHKKKEKRRRWLQPGQAADCSHRFQSMPCRQGIELRHLLSRRRLCWGLLRLMSAGTFPDLCYGNPAVQQGWATFKLWLSVGFPFKPTNNVVFFGT